MNIITFKKRTRNKNCEPFWNVYIDGKIYRRLVIAQISAYQSDQSYYDVFLWREYEAEGQVKARYFNIISYSTNGFETLAEAKHLVLEMLNCDYSLELKFNELRYPENYERLNTSSYPIDDSEEANLQEDFLEAREPREQLYERQMREAVLDIVDFDEIPDAPIDVVNINPSDVINEFFARTGY